MDPVNKWLLTVILFMAATLAVIGWKAGSGRYEMAVAPSAVIEGHYVVSVLDTKDGEVHSKLISEQDLMYNDGRVKSRPEKVFEVPGFSSSYSRRGY